MVYLKSFVVFSCVAAEKIDIVKNVLKLVRNAEDILKLKKRIFFNEAIDYMGHVIFPRCLEIALLTTDYMKKHKASRIVTELKSLLSFCNVSRRLVPSWKENESLLNNNLREDQPLNFFYLTRKSSMWWGASTRSWPSHRYWRHGTQ